jgi:hypothetical protein
LQPDLSHTVVPANSQYQQAQQARFSRLAAQQRIVRRFREEEPADFLALKRCRDDLEKAITVEMGRITASMLKPELRTVSKTLHDCFWLYETRDGRKALHAMDIDLVDRALASSTRSPPMRRFEWPGVENLVGILSDHLPFVEELQKRYNYFDFFTILSMATLCPGQKLYQACSDAMAAEALPRLLRGLDQDELDTPEAAWFHQREDSLELDVAIALRSSLLEDRISMPGVMVFDGKRNPLLKEDSLGTRSMYLRVELGEAPIQIDRAMVFFRNALLHALEDQHGQLDKVPNHDKFAKSKFFDAFSERATLIREAKQVIPELIRLWAWDLVNLDQLKFSDAAAKIEEFTRARSPETEDQVFGYAGEVSKLTSRGVLDRKVAGVSGIELGRRSQEFLKTRRSDTR